MKSAIISGAILICLILLISLNSILCIGMIEELQEHISSDLAVTESGINEIEALWKKRETFLHLGVNSRYIDSITESISQLRAAVKTKSEEDIVSSLETLKLRLDQLEKLNRFSFSNIF